MPEKIAGIDVSGPAQTGMIAIDAKSALGEDILSLPDDFTPGVEPVEEAPPVVEPAKAPEKEEPAGKTEPPKAAPAKAEPVVKEEPPKEPAKAEPQKVKIHGKEFTIEELEKAMEERKQEAASRVATPPQPEKPAAPQYTPEQIRKMESEFVAEYSKSLAAELPGPSEQEVEAILAGGKGAIEALTAVSSRTAALAVMHARKALIGDFAPEVQRLQSQLQPLLEQSMQLQQFTVEQSFLKGFPEFAPHVDLARRVASELLAQYPEVRNYTQDQFLQEVARQTDTILTADFKRWNKDTTTSWRDWGKPAAPAPSAPPPAAPTPATTPPAAAPPKKPTVKPPAGNTPGASPVAPAPDWHKSVAHSLRE